MKIQLIRNATIKLEYGNKTFLIDPYLSEKHQQPSFAGQSKNPVIDLPFSPNEILSGVDYFIVSHLHPDHFDQKAQELLPKDSKIFCQPSDAPLISDFGFKHATSIYDEVTINDIAIARTAGQHGDKQEEAFILKMMGEVSGFVFRHKHEPTLYWMGDTIWYEPLKQVISKYQPEVIICHSGGNRFPIDSPIFGGSKLAKPTKSLVMDKEQTMELCRLAKNSTIIATHIGALDHETVTREELIALGKVHNINKRFLVPQDGDIFIKSFRPAESR